MPKDRWIWAEEVAMTMLVFVRPVSTSAEWIGFGCEV